VRGECHTSVILEGWKYTFSFGKFCYRTLLIFDIAVGHCKKINVPQDTRRCPTTKKLVCYGKENIFQCPTANFTKVLV
jgi:hypothetical protein